MTLSRALSCLLAVTLVSCFLFLLQRGYFAGRSKEPLPSGSNDVAQLRAELEELKQSVKVSEGFARAAVQSVAPIRAVDQKSARSVAEGEPSPGAAPTSGPDDREITRRLEQRFADEKTDPGWSKPSQQIITTHVHQGIPPESKVKSIECRRTMCRVESQHPSFDVYKKFLDEALLFPHGGWDGPVMTSVLSRSPEVKAVGYLFRAGEDLEPLLAPESPPL